MAKAKPVKTTGKGFRLYCRDYRTKRKSRGLKQLTRCELLKKAAELWLKMDRREKSRYSSDAAKKLKSAPLSRRNIVESSAKSPQKSRGRVTKRRTVSPTKQRAINKTYRKRATKRRITPSRSRSCSRTSCTTLPLSSTTLADTGTTCTGFETSTALGDYTSQVSATCTSQTSLTSCTSGGTSYRTSDSSYNQYHDSQPVSKEMEFNLAKSKGKAPAKKPAGNNKQATVSKPNRPPVQVNKRKSAVAEKTAALSRPKRHGVSYDRNNSDSMVDAEVN